MKIDGFQKMTMLDFPERVACTAFTPGCNFRCPFCHNAGLVTHVQAHGGDSTQALFDYLKKRKGLLDGICITGGEPLLWDDIGDFIREVRALGLLVKLDTNGSFPDRLQTLTEAGLLDYVAMDIKNCKEKYALTAGVLDLDLKPIEESVHYLMKGKIPYEFRTTVVRELHTVNDLDAIGQWIRGAKQYFLQAFVDSGDLVGDHMSPPTPEMMHSALSLVQKNVPAAALRGVK